MDQVALVFVYRSLMRNLRVYMAVGGMPQAVEATILPVSILDITQQKPQYNLLSSLNQHHSHRRKSPYTKE